MSILFSVNLDFRILVLCLFPYLVVFVCLFFNFSVVSILVLKQRGRPMEIDVLKMCIYVFSIHRLIKSVDLFFEIDIFKISTYI